MNDHPYQPLRSPSLPSAPDFPKLTQRQWALEPDLDVFFKRIYRYWYGKGFFANLLHEVFNLIGLFFVLLFSGFLLFCVNWEELQSSCEKDCDISTHLLRNPFRSLKPNLWTALKLTYLILFSLYWIGTLIVGFCELVGSWRICQFCKTKLGISEDQIRWISWSEMVRRLVLIQRTTRLCLHRNLTEFDIIHRILRKENYLVGMINKGVLHLQLPLPGFKKRPFLTNMMEWILKWGLLNPMFDQNFEIKTPYRTDPEFLTRRFRTLAVVQMILAPFLFVFLLIYYLMMHVERFYHSPTALTERAWSPFAKWRLRLFNEMDHHLNARLEKSQKPAQEYINQFPNPSLMHLGNLLSFVIGSFVALLLCLALINDKMLESDFMGHALVWWAAVSMIGLQLARGIIPENPSMDPELCLEAIIKYTHFCPRLWRGHARSKEVRESFGNMFRYGALNFLDEIWTVFLGPYLLYFSLPQSSHQIVQFLENYTTRVDGVGDVCSLAVFDFERHGNKKYGSESEGEKSQRSKQGKMEKSFLSFVALYPSWKPPHSGRRLLENLEPFISPEDAPSTSSLRTTSKHTQWRNSDPFGPPKEVPKQSSVEMVKRPLRSSDKEASRIPLRSSDKETSSIRSLDQMEALGINAMGERREERHLTVDTVQNALQSFYQNIAIHQDLHSNRTL